MHVLHIAMKNATTTRLGLLARLRSQHRTIRRNLDRLEALAAAIDRDAPVDPHELQRLRGFFRHFVQAEHEAIEESLLFPALESRCTREEMKELVRLEAEHAWGDALLDEFESAPPPRVAQIVRTFAPLVRMHMEHEESHVFPLAEQRLTGEELALLGIACDAVLGAASPVSRGPAWRVPARANPWCLDDDWQDSTETREL
jgi:hemerythrin-like domain-containing protein